MKPQKLANTTYESGWTRSGRAPLTDGEYSEPAAPGSATVTRISLTGQIAYGRLNEDEVAVVVLVTDPGGSGTFYDLAVVVDRDGRPVNVATARLGDRVEIDSLRVENGRVIVEMIQAGPHDPLCCRSQRVVKAFDLQRDRLVEASSRIVSGDDGTGLVGTVWRWDRTLMNNDDQWAPKDPGDYTVRFSADGSVSIAADCNRIAGRYTLDGRSITVTTGPATLAACPEGSLGERFVAHLIGAASYLVEGRNLSIELKYDSGTMRFTAQSAGLAGTSWVVTGYDNGKGGVVSVIVGTVITADFGEDGRLTGSAGCNEYFASYAGEGYHVSIGPARATRRACSEPEGIMEQERRYLEALGTAVTYSIEGNTLELRTADGARAAVFRAAEELHASLEGR